MKRNIRHISIGCILLLLVVLLAACRDPAASQTDLPTEPEVTSAVAPNEAQLPSLNMQRLTDLVNRCGDSLSWNDFVRFHSVDMGSELCLLRYDMDEEYYVLIGGESRKKPPGFIWLVSREDPDCYIDVRTESIEAFLSCGESSLEKAESPEIIYGDYIDSPFSDGSVIAKRVGATYSLAEVLEQADDDDLIAVVIGGFPLPDGGYFIEYRDSEEYKALSETLQQAQEELDDVANQIVEEMMETRGISREEARVRKYYNPDFVAAREVYHAARRDIEAFNVSQYLERSGDILDKLAALGFTILYDGSNPDYQVYLGSFFRRAIGVAVGTKEQILALNGEDLFFELYLHLAMKDAANLKIDSYSESEIHLTGDNKLTDELLVAYQENGGAALPVKVKIGYFGRRYTTGDATRIALNKIGFATETDMHVYGTEEDVQNFIRERTRILYHKDYNYDVITRFLQENELLQWNGSDNFHNCNFYAMLTYERAMEITQNKEIAYIELLTEYADGSAE